MTDSPQRQQSPSGGRYVVSTWSGKQWFAWCPDCLGRHAKITTKHPYRLTDAWRSPMCATPAQAEELLRQHWAGDGHAESIRTIAAIEQAVGK